MQVLELIRHKATSIWIISKMTGYFQALLGLVCCIWTVSSHPQCLDFRAPFEVKGGIPFCHRYETFSCCDKERDTELRRKYERIDAKIRKKRLSSICFRYVKDLICLYCSPYAAHHFDVENGDEKRALPGMCTTYCERFYDECRDIVEFLTDDKDVIDSLSSKKAFCDKNEVPDRIYCYPDFERNNALNREISRPTTTKEGCLCLEKFAEKLSNPILLISPPDETGRIFIGEQIGMMYIYDRNGEKISDFLNIKQKVLTSSRGGDERGFLSMTFDPRFESNRKFYVYYSTTVRGQHHTRLSEYKVMSSDPNRADSASERILLEIEQPFRNHNGGMLLFGTDGYLYLFNGDGGAAGDPDENAQTIDSLLGKVLRIDVSGTDQRTGKPYRIPRDNPFLSNSSFLPEIYAYGVRNIWRCDIDEGDPITRAGRGRILCGDVGQSRVEEIDLIVKGANYGWDIREGPDCFENCDRIPRSELEEPVHSYRHGNGDCSVTGGNFYRGCLSPNLNGLYIYGDYCSGNMWTLKDMGSGRWENKKLDLCGDDVCFNGLENQFGRNILSFGEDFNGEVYMLATSGASVTRPTGVAYRLVDPRRRGDLTNCRSRTWNMVTKECPVGDEARWCRTIPRYDCYRYPRRCCATCSQRRGTIPGCEYGDRARWCRRLPARDCYSQSNRETCCETCLRERRNKAGCEYGDRDRNCDKRRCSDATTRRRCCRTCEDYVPPAPTSGSSTGLGGSTGSSSSCGDKASWCSRINSGQCYSSRTRDTCCMSCQGHRSARPDCRYGDKFSWCKNDPTRFCETYKADCCETCP